MGVSASMTPKVKDKQIGKHIFIVASQKYRWVPLITQIASRSLAPPKKVWQIISLFNFGQNFPAQSLGLAHTKVSP